VKKKAAEKSPRGAGAACDRELKREQEEPSAINQRHPRWNLRRDRKGAAGGENTSIRRDRATKYTSISGFRDFDERFRNGKKEVMPPGTEGEDHKDAN